MAVSDYDPRWIDMLVDAGKREIIIPFPNLRNALTFRQKLYRLRHSMRREREKPPKSHTQEQWTLALESAERAIARIAFVLPSGEQKVYVNNIKTPQPATLAPFDEKKNLSPILLILKPQDMDYEHILTKAGYAVPELDL